jgi:alkanesulfonate monooxygenase SsuD/methylene tetrahydromethanopterin reductase-like flavin-dependent oxidoreductase (luciferase family)
VQRVRIGLVILPQRRWTQQAPMWQRGEVLGFDHLWTYDHLTWDPLAGTPWGATVPTLVAAAGVTSRVRLGTWVASPNFRHPVPFARELAALDDVSRGRAVLAIGAGGTGHDARVLGGELLAPSDRAARLEEFVDLLDRVLVGDHVSYSGRFYSAVDARTTLPCVQRPRLPFVVAANGPRTLHLAARVGAGWATTGAPGAGGPDATEDAWWAGVASLAERLSEILDADGRPPDAVDRMLSIDAATRYSLSSVEYFTEAVGRAAELGFTDVVAHWPVPGAPVYDAPEDMVERVAELLPRLRQP